MKREVIVIGVTHHNTLSMVRSVGTDYAKVELVLYGSGRQSHIAKSKYVNRTVFLNSVEECLDYLKHRPKGTGKAYIISCTDQIAQILDTNQAELLAKYEFFRSRHASDLTLYMNKQRQVSLAASAGMAVPVSYVYKQGGRLEYRGKYPCIVKPVESYVGGKQIAICHEEQEVRQAVDSAPISWQIQEMVNKEAEIVLAGVAVGSDVIIPGYVHKHRELKGGTTYSTILPLDERMKKLVEQAKEMIRAIGYEGLFGFEFIFDGNEYFFLELNLRNDATCYAYKMAGINLPLLYIERKEQGDCPLDLHQIERLDSMVEPNDFSFVRSGKVGLWKWLQQLKHSKCKYLYDRRDLKPFLYYFAYALRRKL